MDVLHTQARKGGNSVCIQENTGISDPQKSLVTTQALCWTFLQLLLNAVMELSIVTLSKA